MTSSPSDPWSTSPTSVPEPAVPEPTAPTPTWHTPTGPVSTGPVSTGPEPTWNGPARPAVGPGPVIVQIAEIGVTSTVVHTPTGDIPLAGSQWQVSDFWFSTQRTPRWAVIAAIVGFCVLTVFSLLFLLIKESTAQGTVQVVVTNGTYQYVARIPVRDQSAVTAINQQVNYVRTLAAL
jgi:hypothetical protein